MKTPRAYLNIAFDWIGLRSSTQQSLERRTYDFARVVVKPTGVDWEIEFYADTYGHISIANAKSGEVIYETHLAAASEPL